MQDAAGEEAGLTRSGGAVILGDTRTCANGGKALVPVGRWSREAKEGKSDIRVAKVCDLQLIQSTR